MSSSPNRDGAGWHPNRRQVLVGAALGVAAAGTAGAVVAARRPPGYPRTQVASLSELGPGSSANFEYPLAGQKSMLFNFGERVPGGVGPNRSIVAFSVLCQHLGCALNWVADQRYLVCPCHQSKYDPAREGAVVIGVAQRSLPRIQLEVSGGSVYAVGLDGLIFGYRDNFDAPDAKPGGSASGTSS